jgi:signal transduction histidine kinase
MKKLEDRIIKKIYVLETKNTVINFMLKLAGILLSGAVAVFLVQILWEIFAEEQTFNILEIFTDDIEVVWEYLGNIFTVIFNETPLELLVPIGLAAALFLFIALTFILNFGKMKHKLTAAWNYWRRKHN